MDSNVIIPAIAEGHPIQSLYQDIFKKAQDLGLKFQVLGETIQEIERAAKWALELVTHNGEKSINVLFAAAGEAGYRPNQFLQAYIESTGGKPVSFRSYSTNIFGRIPNFSSIVETIEGKLLISKCEIGDLINIGENKAKHFRTKVREEIIRRASESYTDRPSTRIETEATVYTIIALWDDLKREDRIEGRCCFVSLGGTLNWLARSSDVAINCTPVMTLDGLFEILRLVEKPEARMDFFDWIKENYFAASASILNSRAAKKFFSTTIDNAEEEYLENLDSFNEVLDQKLSKGYINEIPALERPFFVQSLELKREVLKKTVEQERYYKEKIKDIEKEKEKAVKTAKYWKHRARLLLKRSSKK